MSTPERNSEFNLFSLEFQCFPRRSRMGADMKYFAIYLNVFEKILVLKENLLRLFLYDILAIEVKKQSLSS